MEYSFDEICKDLPDKKVEVQDLVRFIGNRSEKRANYNLLLGAGCSITSGVRATDELISEWKQEIFRSDPENQSVEITTEIINKYFEEKCRSWYVPQAEYSSLFQKRFPMRSQRRVFIEKEVDGKYPSLGYAYLVKLVKNKFISAIFTTNFDDLINEAFYQFSDSLDGRPLVCAHDSSITSSSISINSDRPKIIKLHGDYLFEDIKSSVSETESLEQNMKDKLKEFSKDLGLIVVGYGGRDRSIMDSVSMLLKQANFFKHGIYWCIKKGSCISEDVRRLLWQDDRVYYLGVDGFDELFATISFGLLEGELPIETGIISETSSRIINKLSENEYIKHSGCKIIKRHIQELNRINNDTKISAFLSRFGKSDDQDGGGGQSIEDDLTDSDYALIIKIDSLIDDREYRKAEDLCLKALPEIEKFHLKQVILKKIINLKCYQGEEEGALQVCDRLIDEDKNDPLNYLRKASIVNDFYAKDELIKKAIEVDPCLSYAWKRRVDLYIKKYEISGLSDRQGILKKIEEFMEKGFQCDPSIDNTVWSSMFDFYINNWKSIDGVKEKIQYLIGFLSNQDPSHPEVMDYRVRFFVKENKESCYGDFEKLRSEIEDCKDKASRRNRILYDLIMLELLSGLDKKLDLKSELTRLTQDSRCKHNLDFLCKYAKILVEKFDDLEKAISILEGCVKRSKKDGPIIMLFDYLIYSENIDRATEVYDEYVSRIKSRKSILLSQNKIHILRKDFDSVLKNLKEIERTVAFKESMVGEWVYIYLLMKDYKKVKEILEEHLKAINFDRTKSVEIINHSLACKRMGQNFNLKRLSEVEGFASSLIEKAAVNLLLGRKDQFYEFLEDAVTKDYTWKYISKDWPLFDEVRKEKRFQDFYFGTINNSVPLERMEETVAAYV